MYFRTFVVMLKKGGTNLGTLYERIQTLCKQKGVSASRMCLDLGLSKSTMSDMKYGRIKGISMPTAQKIAGYFGITVDELYGAENKEKPSVKDEELSDELMELIDCIKKLPEDKIQMLLQVAKSIR